MKNNFLKHFAIIGGGTAVNLLLGLLTTPLITRIVDPIEYGQLSIFTMYSNMALLILCMGLDQAVVRYYYEAEGMEYKRALLFRCIQLPLIASILCSIGVIAFSVSGHVRLEFNSFIIVLLCFYTIIQILYRFSTLVVRLEYKSKLYSALSIVLKIAYILIAVPLLLIVKQNYFLILVIATVMATAICTFISIFAQADIWSFFKLSKTNQNVCDRKELLRYAYPFIISMGITTLFQTIDKLSLNYYSTYSEVGIYSSTMTLVHIFAVIQTAFNALWTPMAVEHYTKNPEDRSFYQRGNQIITVIMFFLGISLILVKDIFAVLLGEKYREAAYILPFLIFNPIMYTISETTVSGLVFMKKSKMQVVVALGACITNIIGNILLVPKLGSQGAAISTGVSYIVFFTLRTVLSNQYFYIDFRLKEFYMLTFAACAYAFYNTFQKFHIGSVIGYLICMVILIVLYYDTIQWGIRYIWDEILLKKRKR